MLQSLFWNNLRMRAKLILGFGLLGIVFIASALYTLHQISETAKITKELSERYAPSRDAIMEAKVHVVLGSLWFEELIAGDSDFNEKQVLNSWNEALWYLQALQKGASRNSIKYLAIDDIHIKKALEHLTNSLHKLINVGQQRLNSYTQKDNNEIAGEHLDEKFDAQFNAFITQISATEKLISAAINTNNSYIDRINQREKDSLLLAVFIMLLMAMIVAYCFSHYVIAVPIGKMLDFINAIARGDMRQQLHLKNHDELGDMGDGLNSMLDNLSELVGRVQMSGIQLASSLNQIAASTREQEATANEHAATANQLAASVNEITATARELGANMDSVSHKAIEMSDAANRGQQVLVALDSGMQRMDEATGQIGDKLNILSDKAGNISSILVTINKVADQTNLLSLNAAIEAEKAGEYGVGFGVVATEIRRLSDQVSISAHDIEQMIREVQSAVSAGVMSMDRFTDEIRRNVNNSRDAGVQLEEVIAQVQSLAPHMESVNEGLRSQIQGAEQINEAISSLSQAAKQTADFVRQSNSAISDLQNAAQVLQEGVAMFKIKDY